MTRADFIKQPRPTAGSRKTLHETAGASLLDLGDGCLELEIHTSRNTVDEDVVAMLRRAVETGERDFAALLIGGAGEFFGTGVSLAALYPLIQSGAWAKVEDRVRSFQEAVQELRYSSIPVLATPFSYCLGASAELAMACDACQAAGETHFGLVEISVGLVPGGGGCLRLLERWLGSVAGVEEASPEPFLARAVEILALARQSADARDARRLRFLRGRDGVTHSREALVAHGKRRALGLAGSGYSPPRARVWKAAGQAVKEGLERRLEALASGDRLSPHDLHIGRRLVGILCGGSNAAGKLLAERHFLDLERETFLSLCGEEKSQARMESLLASNRPLRN